MFIDTGSVTNGTNGVVTVTAAETFDTEGDTVTGGDVTTGAVSGGEREVPGTVEGIVWVKRGPARGVWRGAAWCRAALPLCRATVAGPRGRG